MSINIEKIKEVLIKNNITLYDGLTDEEFEKIEKFYSIKFPISLRTLYKSFLPEFYNWRDFSEENVNKIKYYLNWPIEGILYDIQNNGFWKKCFGQRTNDINENKKIALEFLENSSNETVPKLIPVYAHRYVPCYPDIMDIPVISVYQTDIVFYGKNLEDYFKSEFGMKNCIDDFIKNYLKKKSNSKEDKNEEKIEINEDMSNNNKDDNIQNKENEDNIEKEESIGCQNIADLHYKYIPFWEDIINCRFEDED
jgi:hypothetical protein